MAEEGQTQHTVRSDTYLLLRYDDFGDINAAPENALITALGSVRSLIDNNALHLQNKVCIRVTYNVDAWNRLEDLSERRLPAHYEEVISIICLSLTNMTHGTQRACLMSKKEERWNNYRKPTNWTTFWPLNKSRLMHLQGNTPKYKPK